MGAAIAQWICLRLPSCRPGFESQAHHLCFHRFIELCNVEKTKVKQKRGRDWPIFQKNFVGGSIYYLTGLDSVALLALKLKTDLLAGRIL